MFSLSSKKRIARRPARKKKKSLKKEWKNPQSSPQSLMKEGCWGALMNFCLQNPREILRSVSVPFPAAVSPASSQSHISSGRKFWTSAKNVLKLLLYCHEKPCPNTQPACYSCSSGTWRTAFLFAAPLFKNCYQNLNFFYYISIISSL